MNKRTPANDNAAQPPAFYTVAEVARRWLVDEKTVRRLVWRGEISVIRIGQQIRISLPDLVAYERLNRVGAVA